MFARLISEKKTPKVRDAQNFMKNAKSPGILRVNVNNTTVDLKQYTCISLNLMTSIKPNKKYCTIDR